MGTYLGRETLQSTLVAEALVWAVYGWVAAQEVERGLRVLQLVDLLFTAPVSSFTLPVYYFQIFDITVLL